MLRQAASSLRRAAGEGLVRGDFGSFAQQRAKRKRKDKRQPATTIDDERRRGVAELANGSLKSFLLPLCLSAHDLSRSLIHINASTADGSGHPRRGLWLGAL